MKNIYMDLYANLGISDKNRIFSPHSLLAVLFMALEGSRNKDEIKKNLGITEKFKFPVEFTNIRQNKLFSANSIWHDTGFSFNEWVDILKPYETEIFGEDFDSLECATKMNKWVSTSTCGKINHIIDETNSSIPLVIMNAIYFKGIWLKQFTKKSTSPEIFYNKCGTNVNVMTMKSHEEYKYFIGKDFQAVEIPYKNNELSMIVIMPIKYYPVQEFGIEGSTVVRNNSPSTLCLNEFNTVLNFGQEVTLPINSSKEEKIIKDLADNNIIEIVRVSKRGNIKKNETPIDIDFALDKLNNGDKRKIHLHLPKFKIESEFDLTSLVSGLGIKGAFGLPAYKTLQKAIIEVDEVGTEAAAVTVMYLKCASREDKTVKFDHPFTFLIRENKTKAIIFTGNINNL